MRPYQFTIIAVCGILLMAGGVSFCARNAPNRVEAISNDPAIEAPPPSGEILSGRNASARGGVDAEFEFQFLGRVPAKVADEAYSLTLAGRKVDFPLRVFRSDAGRLVRFEYVKPGSVSYERSAEKLRQTYTRFGDTVHGLAPRAPSIGIVALLNRISAELDISAATRFNVTHVIWSSSGGGMNEPREVFIVNVFGLSVISDRVADTEQNRRIRLILDSNGELLLSDNLL